MEGNDWRPVLGPVFFARVFTPKLQVIKVIGVIVRMGAGERPGRGSASPLTVT